MQAVERERDSGEMARLRRVANLLGGARVLRHAPASPLDTHDMLLEGLPGQAFSYLVDNLVVLQLTTSFEKAVGMSLRTVQRRREAPAKLLNPEQSGRTWKFAEVLDRATAVLGSREEAERWLERPATGLDQRRPLDLLATAAGVEMVEGFLQRMEFGVYT